MGKKDLGDPVKPTASDGTLEAYSGLSAKDALINDCLHIALLKQYNLTEHGYQRITGAKPEGQETPCQFLVRISNYFDKRVGLASVDKLYNGVTELMVCEQLTNLCSKDRAVHLIECSPLDLEELMTIAEQYLVAYNKLLLSRGASENNKRGPWQQGFGQQGTRGGGVMLWLQW